MSSVAIRGAAQVLRPPQDGLPYMRHDRAGELRLDPGDVALDDGRIAGFEAAGADVEVDAAGCAVLPGFVDCHTHLPFAGWRAAEYERKVTGVPYEEISRAGGGIASSARSLAEASDAEVGWNGERLVSTVPSVDGATLRAGSLAELVQDSFLGGHGTVAAPVEIDKPTIDSNNLDALGIVTLLGRGSSNYSGSSDGRATNVEVGAALLNGTLIPPRGEYSFNNSIGHITEDKGFVEAQVILGEAIGSDIGGGICQVSTTVFRAAYFAGMPITEWWPHRWRIPFYEYDGWAPGLDASILQPTPDPSTWGDFRFENPTDSWLLVESWTDGVNVIVNLYGADLGWTVESDGPVMGEKFQVEPDAEVVDPELEPGTIDQTEIAAIGEEVGHLRRVFDRDGSLLWERNFYTKFFPRGNVWKVSPDMKGKSPADPDRKLPPLPAETEIEGEGEAVTPGEPVPAG